MIPLETPVQHDRIPYDRGAWRRTVRYINNHERQADDLWNEELDAQAEECFRFLRRLDPQDAFSIVRMMETRGIAMEDGAAPRTR